MPELRSLTKKLRTVSVPYEDVTISVTYNAAVLTPEWERRYTQAMKGEIKSRPIVETLAEAIVDWDIVENGKPYPPTPENLERLPFDLLVALLTALTGAQVPNQTNGAS